MDMKTIITLLAQVVIPVCGAVITYFIIPWIRAKANQVLTEKQAAGLEMVRQWATLAVHCAEQTFGLGENEDKKRFAVFMVIQFCSRHDIQITEDDASMLVEAAVHSLVPTSWELENKECNEDYCPIPGVNQGE